MTDRVLALDIGGTKLAAGIVDAAGTVVQAVRCPTPVTDDSDQLFRALIDLVGELGPGHVTGVGVGCGGPMQWPSGRVSTLNIPAWREFPLRERLTDHFPGMPVRVHNDAIALAAAEHWLGAGRGCANMMAMVVATGVGAGVVLGNRIYDGGTGNAGHIGHVVVDPDGPPCRCGGRGCLEAIARGPAVIAWAREHGWRAAPGAGGPELAAAARGGDEVAAAAFRRAGHALGIAIASAANVLDVEAVVIGGGFAAVGALLFEPLHATYDAYARTPFVRHTKIVPTQSGKHAGLIGAAALVLGGDRYWSAD